MRTSGWVRVRDLFERALDVAPEQRNAWLEVEAAGDTEVAAEVRSLLSHHTDAGSFLEHPVAGRFPELMADEHAFNPGDNVGSYTIEGEAGRGGMGRVYRARDNRLGRIVALKALSPALTSQPTNRSRLEREARAAAALSHPGICTVHALEEIDGALFIVTEYVKGHTLRAEIGSGRLPDGKAIVALARQLAAALAHAHGRGITHRDLKPENVMRAADGPIKILDFGLATIDEPVPAELGRVTEAGALMGTPAYMSPEQFNGARGDARSDVFAYGVLLYEFSCGVHPFAASTPLATMARIIEGAPDPLRTRRTDLPEAVVGVIQRCLDKSPERRFANGAEIAAVLAHDDARLPVRPLAFWWRAHQLIAVTLYFLACYATWQIKEWLPGVPTAVFVATAVVATAAGILRGHVLFTERMNPGGLQTELPRTRSFTTWADLILALMLGVAGVLGASLQPLAGVLTIALGVGIALARLLVEPVTTAAAFSA